MRDLIQIVDLVKISRSRPTEWKGRAADGTWLYVRYDWGLLEVGFGESPEAAAAAPRWCRLVNEGYERSMYLAALKRATQDLFAWPLRDDEKIEGEVGPR